MKNSTKIWLIILSIIIITSGIIIFSSNNKTTQPSLLGTEPHHYEQIGIKQEQIEIWEDGLRTNGGPGTYEWWYVDAEFEDGTTIVTVFYTKSVFDLPGPAHPKAMINITLADGTKINKTYSEEKGTIINASTEKCDVQIGDSYLKYNEDSYELYFVSENIEYQATMKSTAPMWRPATGHSFYGANQEHYMAWFVAQPSSSITATLKIDGSTTNLIGSGYHDHNWGNIPMNEIVNHWYWGRAKIGEYNIITSDIITAKKYGYTRQPLLLIMKNGELIAYNPENLKVERSDTIQHPITKKFIDNHITFIQTNNDGTVYTIEYIREKDLFTVNLLDNLPLIQRTIAKILRANPTYIRSTGDVILTIDDGENITSFTQKGLWEQMFFGNNKDPHINEQ